MQTGKVDSIDKSKSGKSWRVKIGGKFYGAKFDSHIEGALGKTISFTVESGEYGDWVDTWAYAQGSAPQAPAGVPTATAGRLSEPELRFVSNCVGQAITAKTIVSPDEIGVWTKAAAAAVREV